MKVAFIDSVHPILWDRLVWQGMDCFDLNDHSALNCISQLDQFDGLVIRSKFKLDATTLSKAKKLKFIARAGSGLENIDLEYCSVNNIQVFSSPEGNRDAVAEHALGMLLMLQNHLKRADTEVRNNIWRRAENRGGELKGKTMALIGYGVMGKAFAQRLSGFEMNVIAYDAFKTDFGDQHAKEVNLDLVFDTADFVSLHMNYLDENKGFIDANFINCFKKPFVLINTARGKHVVTSDLVKAIDTGKVLGACLDVLEFETVAFDMDYSADPNFEFLKNSDRVLLSPHIAGWTHESHEKLSAVLADKIENWLGL